MKKWVDRFNYDFPRRLIVVGLSLSFLERPFGKFSNNKFVAILLGAVSLPIYLLGFFISFLASAIHAIKKGE